MFVVILLMTKVATKPLLLLFSVEYSEIRMFPTCSTKYFRKALQFQGTHQQFAASAQEQNTDKAKLVDF